MKKVSFFFLKGVNFGGWFLWEEWMWGGVFYLEILMKICLKELFGEEKYKLFLEEYYLNFVIWKDIWLLL